MSQGEPELVLPAGVSVPAMAVQGLAQHNVCEFSNLAILLPEIYKEFGGRMMA
jgi:phloretin hydrolase